MTVEALENDLFLPTAVGVKTEIPKSVLDDG